MHRDEGERDSFCECSLDTKRSSVASEKKTAAVEVVQEGEARRKRRKRKGKSRGRWHRGRLSFIYFIVVRCADLFERSK